MIDYSMQNKALHLTLPRFSVQALDFLFPHLVLHQALTGSADELGR